MNGDVESRLREAARQQFYVGLVILDYHEPQGDVHLVTYLIRMRHGPMRIAERDS